MKVRQLIAELKEMPQDAEVYITDDGTAWVESWNSGIEDISTVDGNVIIEFEGHFLRNAVELSS